MGLRIRAAVLALAALLSLAAVLPLAAAAQESTVPVEIQQHRAAGSRLIDRSRPREALMEFRQALALSRRLLGERHLETAADWESVGALYHDLGEEGPARKAVETALGIRIEVLGAEHLETGRTLVYLARILQSSGDPAGARARFVVAEGILRKYPGKAGPWLASVLESLGKMEEAAGHPDRALTRLQEALDLRIRFQGPGSPAALAACESVALVLERAGRPKEAEARFRQALASAAPGDDNRVARLCRGLGTALFDQGRYEEARRAFEEELARSGSAGKDGELRRAEALSGLGRVAFMAGDHARARALFEEARDIRIRIQDPRSVAVANSYNDLAEVSFLDRDFERALEDYDRALSIVLERLGPRHPLAVTALHHRGRVLVYLDRDAEAREAMEEALVLAGEVFGPDSAAVANIRNSLGLAALRRKQYPEALRHLEEALRIVRATRDAKHPWVASVLENLGVCHMKLEDFDRARGCLEEAARLREGETSFEKVIPALGLGSLDLLQGRPGRAVEYLRPAVQTIRDSFGAGGGLPAVPFAELGVELLGRASLQAWRESGRTEDLLEADASLQEAVELVSRIRGGMVGSESRLRLGEFKYEVYPAAALAAVERDRVEPGRGHLERALKAAEEGVARNLLEILTAARSTDLGGVPAERVEELLDLQRRMEALARSLEDPADLDRQARVRSLRELEEQHDRAVDRLRADYARYAELQYPHPASLAEIRSSLEPDEAALLFMLGKDDSVGFLVTDSRLSAFRLAPRAVLEDRAERLVRAVTVGAVPARAPGPGDPVETLRTEVGDLLFGGLEPGALGGRRLVLVPTGGLWELPFEVLPPPPGEEGRFLVEGHEVLYAPSLSLFHLTRLWDRTRKMPPARVLLFGDPLYSESDGESTEIAMSAYRSRDSGLAFLPLPFTREEVTEIARVVGPERSEVLVGRGASEAAWSTVPVEEFRYLHFATHGVLGRSGKVGPALVLSLAGNPSGVDGFLTMEEIMDRPLRARLVVLSACETGQGRLRQGEGVVGLARAFLHAGASAVVASLWCVEDRSTAGFMVDFYRGLEAGKSSAAALRGARLEGIRQGQDASLWAPFVLVGRP